MRRTPVLLALAACGRVDFASIVPPDAVDAADAVAAGLRATQVMGVALLDGIPASDLAIARLPGGGHAVGWLGAAPSYLYGIVVDASGQSSVSVPWMISPVAGSTYGYDTATLAVTNGVLTGALHVTDDTLFLKTFPPDFSTFSTYEMHLGAPATPAYGAASGVAMAIFTSGGLLTAVGIGADGQPQTAEMPLGVSSTGVASVASIAGAVLAFTETTPDVCTIVTVSASFTAAPGSDRTPCKHPAIGSRGNADAVMAYETPAGATVFHLASGGDQVLPGAQRPRVGYTATAECVTVFADGALRVLQLATGAITPIAGVPAGNPDAYAVDRDTGFALWGDELYRFPACL